MWWTFLKIISSVPHNTVMNLNYNVIMTPKGLDANFITTKNGCMAHGAWASQKATYNTLLEAVPKLTLTATASHPPLTQNLTISITSTWQRSFLPWKRNRWKIHAPSPRTNFAGFSHFPPHAHNSGLPACLPAHYRMHLQLHLRS